jgi:thiamine monophosphate kinase
LTSTFPDELNSVARRLGSSALDCALYGGEDYALLATGPRQKRPRFAVVIGHVERGRGVWLHDAQGRRRTLGCGFDHFRNTI